MDYEREFYMKKAKRFLPVLCVLVLGLSACASEPSEKETAQDTLVYASGDYTRIDPIVDEHGEINLLLFDGLTAHGANNEIEPALAQSWEHDEKENTWTFHLRDDVKWQDGQPFTASDVKFTIEAIMDPANESENAANFIDVGSIEVPDDETVIFHLLDKNAAFIDYMTIPILPEHRLEGEDMQTSDFFRMPVGTGPYQIESWDEGQAITMKANADYYKGKPKIETVIFKIVPDNSTKALQLKSGEVDLAQISPRDAGTFNDSGTIRVLDMKTADYRGILYNFNNPYWTENKDLIPAFSYAVDRQAIVSSVLLGKGEAAYSPIQKNEYNDPAIEHFDYDPQRSEQILQERGCTKNKDGYYERNGEEIAFTLVAPADDQVRKDIAQAVSQQLRQAGVRCTVDIPSQVDWSDQMAYLIGWGSPFDADDHTFKVFGTGQGANYSSYSDEKVDEYLALARSTSDPKVRRKAYSDFLHQMCADPAFTYICYVDAVYAADDTIEGIDESLILGHHGVGIFWNIEDWTIKEGE